MKMPMKDLIMNNDPPMNFSRILFLPLPTNLLPVKGLRASILTNKAYSFTHFFPPCVWEFQFRHLQNLRTGAEIGNNDIHLQDRNEWVAYRAERVVRSGTKSRSPVMYKGKDNYLHCKFRSPYISAQIMYKHDDLINFSKPENMSSSFLAINTPAIEQALKRPCLKYSIYTQNIGKMAIVSTGKSEPADLILPQHSWKLLRERLTTLFFIYFCLLQTAAQCFLGRKRTFGSNSSMLNE